MFKPYIQCGESSGSQKCSFSLVKPLFSEDLKQNSLCEIRDDSLMRLTVCF